MWAAMFQQRPAPEEGDFCKAEWLKPYRNLPLSSPQSVYCLASYVHAARLHLIRVSPGRAKRVLIPPRPQNPLIGLQPPQRQIPRLRDLAEQFANGRCSAGHALLEAKIVYQSQFLGGQHDLKALTPRPTCPFWTSVDFVKVICEANLRRPS